MPDGMLDGMHDCMYDIGLMPPKRSALRRLAVLSMSPVWVGRRIDASVVSVSVGAVGGCRQSETDVV